jgi:arylsulfatase A-like enzyme
MQNIGRNRLRQRRLWSWVALAMLCLGVRTTVGAERPNVVLVITDDQGYGDLGCHGHPFLKTPNIDRLYQQSIRFDHFHATPLCTTSRATLMTGRHCLRTGAWSVLNGRSLLRRQESTLAESFVRANYATGLFGKWHLGDNYPFRPQDRGFQQVLWHGGGGIGTTPDYWKNDYFDDTFHRREAWQKLQGYGTDGLFHEAIAFIEDNQERPFFCWLATDAPHDPFNVDERYSRPYLSKVDQETAKFYGMIANLDENIGRLLEKLDDLKLSEDTILIFMTDNGSSGGWKTFNAGMRGGKGTPYDGGHRVPCFIRWPGGGLGDPRSVSAMTSIADIFPSLVEACLLPSSSDAASSTRNLDGQSFIGPLRGHRSFDSERLIFPGVYSGSAPTSFQQTAILNQQWRLVHGQELYEIHSDPAQKNNLAKNNPGLVQAMRSQYEKWRKPIEESFNDVPRIVVGNRLENPLWLTAWDLFGQSVYMQHQVEECERADGYWEIDVETAGSYQVTLRRWPPEVYRKLQDGLTVKRVAKEGKPETVIEGADTARLSIGGQDVSKAINPTDTEVNFEVRLPAGPCRLQGWFMNTKALGGATWGVYYVGLEKL